MREAAILFRVARDGEERSAFVGLEEGDELGGKAEFAANGNKSLRGGLGVTQKRNNIIKISSHASEN